MKEKTQESQYQCCLDIRDKKGLTRFGLMSNQAWIDDPKRLVFLLSRYKFVAKMFAGLENVLEIGCADAFGTRIVSQEVKKITAVDFDPVFIKDAQSRNREDWNIDLKVHDILKGSVEDNFDAAYSLDVLEHIAEENEKTFMKNILNSLSKYGILIVGSPSIYSQAYASPPSKAGHVNCKNYQKLKALMLEYFNNVFVFSMNDEVVHTGFSPMANYYLALCCSKK